MKTTSFTQNILIIFSIFVFVCIVNSALLPNKQNIYELTLENYNEAKKTFPNLIILYINEERTSKKFVPEYNKAVEKLRRNKNLQEKLYFAIVNSTTQEELAQKLEIQVFPTIFLFQGETKLKYKGFWSAIDFESWVQLNLIQVRKSSKEVKSTDEFDRRMMLQSQMIAFFGTNEETPEFATFISMTENKKEYYYAHTFDERTKKDFDIKANEQQLVLFSQEERKRYQYLYKGNYTDEKDMIHFLKVYGFPGFMDAENNVMYNRVFESNLPSLILAYNKSNIAHVQLFDVLESLRIPLFKKITLGAFDVETMDAGHSFFFDFKLPNKIVPALGFVDRKNGKLQQYAFKLKYTYLEEKLNLIKKEFEEIDEDDQSKKTEAMRKTIQKKLYETEKSHWAERLSQDLILDFISSCQQGKIQRILTQQAIPDKNDQPIQKLVRDTFTQFVNTPGKDVLIMFINEECYQCEQLLHVVNKVAIQLNRNKNLIFGTINLGKNEVDEIGELKQYPQLQLYTSKDKKNSIDVLYQTKQNSLIEFLKTSISVEWVAPLTDEQIKTSKHYVIEKKEEL